MTKSITVDFMRLLIMVLILMVILLINNEQSESLVSVQYLAIILNLIILEMKS